MRIYNSLPNYIIFSQGCWEPLREFMYINMKLRENIGYVSNNDEAEADDGEK
jgi:hypothetical protein